MCKSRGNTPQQNGGFGGARGDIQRYGCFNDVDYFSQERKGVRIGNSKAPNGRGEAAGWSLCGGGKRGRFRRLPMKWRWAPERLRLWAGAGPSRFKKLSSAVETAILGGDGFFGFTWRRLSSLASMTALYQMDDCSFGARSLDVFLAKISLDLPPLLQADWPLIERGVGACQEPTGYSNSQT